MIGSELALRLASVLLLGEFWIITQALLSVISGSLSQSGFLLIILRWSIV
jgi:hypothetical protein